MSFPEIDPVAFAVGPLVVRWYALAYLAGILVGWRWCMAMARRPSSLVRPEHFDEFLTWAVAGIVLGGRLGYVLFYNFDTYLHNPFEALKVWHGGMSFHGGMVGVIAAAWIFTWVKKVPFFAFADLLSCVTPIGLGLGRLANFINGELYGRVTDVWWGVVFPRGGEMPRHPSQLYEAAAEGVVLFALLLVLARMAWVRERRGILSGVFLSGYGILRFGIEFFREPDAQLGYLFAGATMGQLLCIPMIVAGGAIVAWAIKRRKNAGKE